MTIKELLKMMKEEKEFHKRHPEMIIVWIMYIGIFLYFFIKNK